MIFALLRDTKHVKYSIGFLTLEDGIDRLSRNVGKELLLYAA